MASNFCLQITSFNRELWISVTFSTSQSIPPTPHQASRVSNFAPYLDRSHPSLSSPSTSNSWGLPILCQFGSQTYLKSTIFSPSLAYGPSRPLQFICFYPGLSTIHYNTLWSIIQMSSHCTSQSPSHTRALPVESTVGPSPPCWPCYRYAHLSRPLFPQTTSVLLQDFCKCYSPRMLFLFAQPAPSLPVISLLPYLKQIPLSEYWGVGCSGSKVDRHLGWIKSQVGVGQVWDTRLKR